MVKNLLVFFILVISLFIISCGGEKSAKTTQVENPNIDTPAVSLRIACVGDSLTEGIGVSNPIKDAYPAQLSKLFTTSVQVKNFGLSKATLIKTGDISYWESIHFTDSHDFNPDIVIIMLGSNDIRPENINEIDRYLEDYTALIKSYKSLSSKPTIYICYPTPSFGKFAGITNANIVNILLGKIEKVSQINNVEIIDNYTLLVNKKSLFPDTLHPNTEGYGILAKGIYDSIK